MNNQDPCLFIPIIDLQSVFFLLQINMITNINITKIKSAYIDLVISFF